MPVWTCTNFSPGYVTAQFYVYLQERENWYRQAYTAHWHCCVRCVVHTMARREGKSSAEFISLVQRVHQNYVHAGLMISSGMNLIIQTSSRLQILTRGRAIVCERNFSSSASSGCRENCRDSENACDSFWVTTDTVAVIKDPFRRESEKKAWIYRWEIAVTGRFECEW